ncbi:polyphosphate:nucleotide phosphotransferase, PPK2 family [Noviherbaspirillum humi]|uniref:Polyphosphate:nucleotide phosphotransferase, PPK2 family n=1 Tax=Noviherbaspirillum humi TaxID=1688639 RepID=A0A239KLQ7_9BURK|nr:PPK2 family polyphosphate kinase [Noviherbaspirillum humi]SNT18628.1 polyphosphate:nucleotide phosphotransferase, PPK2 family [Noviherbaspirillum humi]
MNARKQFRAPQGLKLKENAAGEKPLSSGDKVKDQARVADLAEQIAAYQDIFYAEHGRKLLVLLQGMDTSGKDGTVRGVFGKLDPLGVRSIAFRAPSIDEREHDFLWRVHAQVPAQGQTVIFNRSHYEDVLVPAVHGKIDAEECKRRYRHIREFERMLCETGTVMVKFFLHISKEEQQKRLQARLIEGDKHWKVDLGDLEERKYWDDYQRLYEKAIAETDSDEAPWYVIPADSKTHRNLAIAAIMVEVLQDMKLAYPPPNPDYFKIQVS